MYYKHITSLQQLTMFYPSKTKVNIYYTKPKQHKMFKPTLTNYWNIHTRWQTLRPSRTSFQQSLNRDPTISCFDSCSYTFQIIRPSVPTISKIISKQFPIKRILNSTTSQHFPQNANCGPTFSATWGRMLYSG